LIGKLREPIDCDGLPGAIVPAVGLARFVPGSTHPEDTVLAALVAALDARVTDESWLLHDAGAGQAQKRIQLLLAGLRPALAAPDQLNLVYQPRIDLRSGNCLGAEALLRWNHPAIGGIPPGEFIPLAEQTGLIRFVTEWVMEQAFADVTGWVRNGYRHGVSINVSALNLAEANFAHTLGDSIRRQGVNPALVEVELTEGALIGDGARLRATVADIAALGLRISIDDFGTGYSNLFYLRQFPATTIKIDQSFIRSLPDNTRDQTIVRSMIELAHTLGYRVVAEGIETRAALDALIAWGCDEGQGYLLSRPVPTDALLAWISARGDANGAL
jgi:EAL domain-containing protein (putative c-di-GMP-specific phosphodiesterase class I)